MNHTVAFSSRSRAWKWFVLRGAGFPVSLLEKLRAPELSELADAFLRTESELNCEMVEVLAKLDELVDAPVQELRSIRKKLKKGRIPASLGSGERAQAHLASLLTHQASLEGLSEDLDSAYDAHCETLERDLASLAAMPQFVEAMLWQNPNAARTALPRVRERRGPRGKLNLGQDLVVKYLQRYCAKNDTIGFFGPVHWARLVGEKGHAKSLPGTSLLEKRAVFFEDWSIDRLAENYSDDPSILAQLAPRLHPAVRLEGTTLSFAGRGKIEVTREVAELLLACQGQSAATIAQERIGPDFSDEDDVFELLQQLVERGALIWRLEVPALADDGLGLLRERLALLDGSAAAQACVELAELDALRRDLEAAAGDPDALQLAMDALTDAFLRITGSDGARGAGEMYSGRTLVFEDCCRSQELVLGPEFLEPLSAPLECVLQSARWFVCEGSRRFEKLAEESATALLEAGGTDELELLSLLKDLMPRVHEPGADGFVGGLVADLRVRWRQILDANPGPQLSSAEIVDEVRQRFACDSAGWPGSVYQAPDLMVAAKSVEEVLSGEASVVLGELHVGSNTLTQACFLRWSGDRDAIANAFASDVGPVFVETLTSKEVGSRANNTSPVSEHFQVCMDEGASPRPPERRLAIANLVVRRSAGALLVFDRASGEQFDILTILQSQVRGPLLQAFSPFGGAGYSKRLSIDNLVVSRERWSFAKHEIPSLPSARGLAQYLEVRRWAQQQGLPSKLFYKSKEEVKPVMLDLDSPASIRLFVSIARRSSSLSLSEMLPTPEQTWLADAEGNTYTSELRMAFVGQEQGR